MEPDRQFAELLEQLRAAHERQVAEVSRLKGQLEARNAPGEQESQKDEGYPQSAAHDTIPAPASTLDSAAPSTAPSGTVAQADVTLAVKQAASASTLDCAAPSNAPSGIAVQSDAPAAHRSSSGKEHSPTRNPGGLLLVEEEKTRFETWWIRFDFLIGACIVISMAVMFLSLHIDGAKTGAELLHEPPPNFSGLEEFVHFTEHVFNMVFLAEFLMRVWFFRMSYVYDRQTIQWFNLFDGALIWLTIVEAYLLTSLSLNTSFLRVVRIIRLLRTLRIVRTVRFFSSLRVLVATVVACYSALFWSMVLLAIVMVMAALSLCQLLGNAILDEENVPLPSRTWINRHYGTPGRALYTIFEMTFSGCWPSYARALVEDVSPVWALFFVFYIGGVVFAMFRIITALFLKDTLQVASTDADMQIQAKMKEKQSYAKKLIQFFREIDTSGDGFISFGEFMAMLQEPRASAYLAYLELEPSESVALFNIMDDGDGYVSTEEFVTSALRLKGVARNQDLVILSHEINKIKRDLKNIERVTHTTHSAVSTYQADSTARDDRGSINAHV